MTYLPLLFAPIPKRLSGTSVRVHTITTKVLPSSSSSNCFCSYRIPALSSSPPRIELVAEFEGSESLKMSSAFIISPFGVSSRVHNILPRARTGFRPNVVTLPYLPVRLHSCAQHQNGSQLQSTTPTSLHSSGFSPIVPTVSFSSEDDQAIGAPSWQDPAYAGGSGDSSGGSGSSSGGSGGEGEAADDQPDDEALGTLLSARNASLSDVPADILGAYHNGYIGLDAISNFLTANSNFLSRLLMRCGSGMRNRFLADKLFLLKIMIEEGIGVVGKLSAEYQQRRSDFWLQKEFVFANLVTAVLADFALVYLPAPSIALTRATGQTGIRAWLANLSTTLPSNIFQTDRAFTMAQRAGGFALKASQLFVVGMMCCLVGSAVTNSLVFVRERLDKSYVPKTEKPNVLAVSLLYATFLGVSSGSRYQLVNGVESHIFPRVFAKTPKLVEEVATFFLRYGNTFWGSQQWVMFTRFTNVQRNKEE